MTLVSLTTSASPGSSSAEDRDDAVAQHGSSGRTTSSRAASRGCAGRSAMLSAGSSKSKRSVRMVSRLIPSVLAYAAESEQRGKVQYGYSRFPGSCFARSPE